MSQAASNRSAPLPPEPIHRFSVEQYREMARVGVLTPSDQVELLEGWLVEKMTKNPPHRIATRRIRVALENVVPAGWYVDTQEPITTTDSEPEPDVAVIRGQTEDYRDRHPGPEQVGLIVEVADATLIRDRQLKGRVYARARVPVYWLVNLTDGCLEIYTQPSGDSDNPRYEQASTLRAGASVDVRLDGAVAGRVQVKDLLP